jgi:transketolase
MVVARTVMGNGVSFMEDRPAWHYHSLDPDQRDQALAELEASQ